MRWGCETTVEFAVPYLVFFIPVILIYNYAEILYSLKKELLFLSFFVWTHVLVNLCLVLTKSPGLVIKSVSNEMNMVSYFITRAKLPGVSISGDCTSRGTNTISLKLGHSSNYKSQTPLFIRPNGTFVFPTWCFTCDIFRPDVKYHHCFTCRICVGELDHHCGLLEKCIGGVNYRFFVDFVFYISMLCLLLVVLSILIIKNLVYDKHMSLISMAFFPILWLCISLIVVFFILGNFAIYHFSLICNDKTTRIHAKGLYTRRYRSEYEEFINDIQLDIPKQEMSSCRNFFRFFLRSPPTDFTKYHIAK